MNTVEDGGPLSFFKALHGAFTDTLRAGDRANLAQSLAAQALNTYEGNIGIQSEGLPPVACFKGCSPCCVLRIAATAPEVFLIAQYLEATAPAYARADIDLLGELARADRLTRGLNEDERMRSRQRCPFLVSDVCAIYQVRPLSCRGHTSFDRQACADALSGKQTEVPVSEPHAAVRAIVQNALQSALRDFSLAWGAYELNHALTIALADAACQSRWLAGQDVFAPALVDGFDFAETAKTFDAINAGAG